MSDSEVELPNSGPVTGRRQGILYTQRTAQAVYDDVRAAKGLGNQFLQALRPVRHLQIESNPNMPALRIGHRCQDLVQIRTGTAHDDHTRAFRPEREGYGTADIFAASGHQGYPIADTQIHAIFRFGLRERFARVDP